MWPFQRNRKKKQTEPSSPEGSSQVLSVLHPDDVKSLGRLPNEAIAGLINRNLNTGDKISVEQFRPNPVFIRFMHNVIKLFGPDDPELQQAAVQQREGWIYIIDLRTPAGPHGRVPPEDIIGAFEVKNDQIIRNSYNINDKHLVFSEHGLVQLSPFLHKTFIRELKRLKAS
jgi:hypothetical protein